MSWSDGLWIELILTSCALINTVPIYIYIHSLSILIIYIYTYVLGWVWHCKLTLNIQDIGSTQAASNKQRACVTPYAIHILIIHSELMVHTFYNYRINYEMGRRWLWTKDFLHYFQSLLSIDISSNICTYTCFCLITKKTISYFNSRNNALHLFYIY